MITILDYTTMKRFLIATIVWVSLAANFSAQAQDAWYDKKFQTTFGVGGGSIYAIVESITYGIFSALSEESVEKFEGGVPITAGYMYNLNKHIGVGADFTIENNKAIFKDGKEDAKINHYSLMPTIRAYWFNNAHFSMYSKASFGGALVICNDGSSKETDCGCIFQVSPIGMEVGGSQLRGFAEIGFGAQGMAMAGIRLAL